MAQSKRGAPVSPMARAVWAKDSARSESLRQSSLEDRTIGALFKFWGLTKQRVLALRRAAGGNFDLEWFNYLAGFPLKLGSVRPAPHETFVGAIKAMQGADNKFSNWGLLRAYETVRESWPGEPSGILTRWADMGNDCIFYSRPVDDPPERPREPGVFEAVCVRGRHMYFLTPLQSVRSSLGRSWRPEDIQA